MLEVVFGVEASLHTKIVCVTYDSCCMLEVVFGIEVLDAMGQL